MGFIPAKVPYTKIRRGCVCTCARSLYFSVAGVTDKSAVRIDVSVHGAYGVSVYCSGCVGRSE